jgi:outer membrane receptor for ferrienterochelin and colicins
MRLTDLYRLFLTVSIMVLLPALVDAQELDDLLDLSLDELINVQVVSATKKEQSINEAPAIISIITRQQIWERGYRTVGEALKQTAGLDVLHDRYQFNMGLRGVNGGMRSWSRIIKLMIDGQPVAYRPTSENFLGSELIPITVVERIEIVRGPASALYGSNAFLGVINIITRESEEAHWGEIAAHYGTSEDLNGWGTDLTFGGKSGNLAFLAAGTLNRHDQSGLAPINVPGATTYDSDAASENDIARPRSLFAKLQYEKESFGQLSLHFNYQTMDSYGEFQDWGVLTHNNRLHVNNFFLQTKYSNNFTEHVAGNISVAVSDGGPAENDVLDVDNNPLTWITRDVGYTGVDVTAELDFSMSEKNSIRIGIDHTTDIQNLQTHYINSSNTERSPTQGIEYGEKNFLNTGLFLQTILYPVERFGITVGVRYDGHSIYEDVLNYRLAGVYQVSKNMYTKLMYGTSYKAPSSVQLFSNYIVSEGVVGNPDLKPESARTLEAAFGARLGKNLNVSLNAFYNTIEDKVEFVLPIGSISNVKPDNIAQINSAGFEYEMLYNTEHVRSYASVSYQKSIIEKEHPVRGAVKLNTELYPACTVKFGVNYALPANYLNINLEGRYTGTRVASELNSFAYDPVNYRTDRYTLDRYMLMDCTLSSTALSILPGSRTMLRFKVSNVFNKKYSYPGFRNFDIPGFERTFWCNVSQLF